MEATSIRQKNDNKRLLKLLFLSKYQKNIQSIKRIKTIEKRNKDGKNDMKRNGNEMRA